MKIILGTPHLGSTPGKQSPDGRLREAVYGREIVVDCKAILTSYGHDVLVDYEPLEPKPEWTQARQKAGYGAEQSKELSYRVQRVNAWCDYHGKDNCLYVSIHLNAAGADGNWHDARGWSVYTSPGRTKSDDLATCIWNAAKKNLPNDCKNAIRADWSDKDPDYESALYVLTHTKCPAVLTENLFQDNRDDVAFLDSDAGRHAIERLHVEGIIDYIQKYMS